MGSINDSDIIPKWPVPTIDFSKFSQSTGKEERLQASKELVEACRSLGCVYITNLSLPDGLVSEAFDTVKRLFALSHENKMQAPHPDHSNIHRGYSYPGLEMVNRPKPGETNFTQDWRETYDIGSEENSEQPNIWLPEKTLPGFRQFANRFYWECDRVSRVILTALALGLGVEEPQDLMKYHSGHNNQLRLAHYPSLLVAELENETKARLPAHSDFTTFTLLFSDECGGLEFEDPHNPGEFIPIPPKPDACLLNIGDFLMIWSNDYLPSTKHRVGLSPQSDRFENGKKMTQDRFSIPYFVDPDSDAVVECLPSCVSADRAARYEPVTQRAWAKMKFANVFPSEE